jgi:hypothetical protein
MSLESGQIGHSSNRPEAAYTHPGSGGAHRASGGGKSGGAGKKELSADEKKQVEQLKSVDREVRAHESAHVGAGGGVVKGGASFQYQSGPDGQQYAVGGEVSIDASPVKGNPQATIQKMQMVIRAALAPAQPSGQDRSVAASASQAMAQAQQELTESKKAGGKGTGTAPKTGGYDNKGFSIQSKTAQTVSALINTFA